MAFREPICINYMDTSTPLKLQDSRKLKHLSACVGTDKNLDYVANYLKDAELLNATKIEGTRIIKVPTLSNYEQGLQKELHECAYPFIERDFTLHKPSSGMKYSSEGGIHQDDKVQHATRVTLMYCGGVDVMKLKEELKAFGDLIVLDSIPISNEAFIIVLICTPELNLAGLNFPELYHQSIRGIFCSTSSIFDLLIWVDVEAFSRDLLDIF